MNESTDWFEKEKCVLNMVARAFARSMEKGMGDKDRKVNGKNIWYFHLITQSFTQCMHCGVGIVEFTAKHCKSIEKRTWSKIRMQFALQTQNVQELRKWYSRVHTFTQHCAVRTLFCKRFIRSEVVWPIAYCLLAFHHSCLI